MAERRFRARWRRCLLVAAAGFLIAIHGITADTPVPAGTEGKAVLTLDEADRRLGVAFRMLEGGIYDRALDLANSVLDDPAAQAVEGSPGNIQDWLVRREAARFARERGRLGLAVSGDDIADIAAAFVQLHLNRYRLPEPTYATQAAYWAGRAFESLGDNREAVEYYSRVGGISLPQGMEGDAAQRMSRCLRHQAEDIPYPGSLRDRARRDRLLNQAINELDRARLAFPIGIRRKEIELDLIRLRLARRQEQFVREAATEAEAYIESDPAKDELRARATVYRGQAAALLGDPVDAAAWFERAVSEESPSPDDRRQARLGLALALLELSESAGDGEKRDILARAEASLDEVIAGAMSPGPWDGARVIKAEVQIELGQPSAALETLVPVLNGRRPNHAALRLAGLASLRRGRLADAIRFLYPASRPSDADLGLRYLASREASQAAQMRRDLGLALALNHQASRMLRRDRLYSSLLVSEFTAMEILLKLARAGGPATLSGDSDLLMADGVEMPASPDEWKGDHARHLGEALGAILWRGGDPDAGYDAGVAAETVREWSGDSLDTLELVIRMIGHLRSRRPSGITDSALLSRLGQARHSLALIRAERVLAADAPDEESIDRTLGDFASAAESFQEASDGGLSVQDSLDQGMVNMESGAFLMRLTSRWERGPWAARALVWREEARQRIEASLRPFNHAIATSGPSSLAARRARWSRGRAFELMQEWRGAAADYLALVNNSELPRLLRANAARRWAVSMSHLGESRAALTRLSVFAEIDAEAALLAGRLAEEAGYPREAYGRYLFAASPASPSLPPATPGRLQEAAYHAARLALVDANEVNPLLPEEEVIAASRKLLLDSARGDLTGDWAVPMLRLLGENLLHDREGWTEAYRLTTEINATAEAPPAVQRAMHLLAAQAQAAGGNFEAAHDELDRARDLLDGSAAQRADAALITLETARLFRSQERYDDALRAYADVFAVFPEQEEAEGAARTEAAVMLLSRPDADARHREQAQGILSGLRDQMQAEKIMRDYGIR